MIHSTDGGSYAYCPCGVCGPFRRLLRWAKADDRAHRAVCSLKRGRR